MGRRGREPGWAQFLPFPEILNAALPEPGPAISPELDQPTAPASGFTFPSASQRETSWNSPRNPGVPQGEGAKFVGLWVVGFFFGCSYLIGVFPLYLLHKTPWTPSWSFVVLPLTRAFTLEILGTGLSIKIRAPAEQKDEGFTPILPLAWKETSLGWRQGISASHSKSLDSLQSQARGAWPWICLGNGGWGQEGVAGPSPWAPGKQSREIRECCQKLSLGESLWGFPQTIPQIWEARGSRS